MEDRFKYRFYHPKKEVYEHGKLIKSESYDAHMVYEHILDLDRLSIDEDTVIMQCTGLKDKNGKLIYESDIVKRNKDVGVIAYSDLQARLVFNKGSHSYSLSSLESYEIIGNIYESHPELLEGN